MNDLWLVRFCLWFWSESLFAVNTETWVLYWILTCRIIERLILVYINISRTFPNCVAQNQNFLTPIKYVYMLKLPLTSSGVNSPRAARSWKVRGCEVTSRFKVLTFPRWRLVRIVIACQETRCVSDLLKLYFIYMHFKPTLSTYKL
jgi:hypothetical protein